MQSIGERLEEARKKKETAEMPGTYEKDKFDIGIPDIYVRGFLNNYSKFLHIDPSKIITDYNAFKLGRSKISKRDRGELLGRVDIPDSGQETDAAEQETLQTGNLAPPGSMGAEPRLRGSALSSEPEPEVDYSLYWKLGFAVAAVFAVFILLVYVVWNVITKESPEINPALAESQVVDTPPAQILDSKEEIIRLVASGDVHVLVIEKVSNQRLFSGSIASGEEVEVTKSGPVTIAFSEGRNLSYVKGGQNYAPDTVGLGRISVP